MSQPISEENSTKKTTGKLVALVLIIVYLGILVALFMKDNSSKSTELTPVQKDNCWGYENKDKDLVIDYYFASADKFIGDHAIVKAADYLGVINTDGKYMIEPKYTEIKNMGKVYVIAKAQDGFYYIISTEDSAVSFGPYSESPIVGDNDICIVKDNETGLYGLFVDDALKYACEYNSITAKSDSKYELQKGSVITTYTYSK